MVVLLHGLAGGWDELAVAVVALGVMWVAVKLAGRRAASDEDEQAESDAAETQVDQEQADPAHPAPTKLG
jgi:hypothetical protein